MLAAVSRVHLIISSWQQRDTHSHMCIRYHSHEKSINIKLYHTQSISNNSIYLEQLNTLLSGCRLCGCVSMCLLYIICTSNPRNNIFACHQQKRYLYIAFGQVSKYWSKYTYPTPRDDVQMYETWWTFIHIALISLILVHISSFISPGRLTAISHTWTHKYVFLPLVSRGDKYFATYTRAYTPQNKFLLLLFSKSLFCVVVVGVVVVVA